MLRAREEACPCFQRTQVLIPALLLTRPMTLGLSAPRLSHLEDRCETQAAGGRAGDKRLLLLRLPSPTGQLGR